MARPERLLDWVQSRRPHVLLVTDDGERASRAREVVSQAAPEAGYVVLVHEPTPEKYRRLLATCAAVLPASSPDDDVVVAVAGAWRALTTLPTAAARTLSGAHHGEPVAVTPREAAWLRALADGVTVASLARASGYSQREMYRLLAAVYARLGTDNRTDALLRADRAGLLAPRPLPLGRGRRTADLRSPTMTATTTAALVSTAWLAEHHGDPDVVVVQVDREAAGYYEAHVPGALPLDWLDELHAPGAPGVRRCRHGRGGAGHAGGSGRTPMSSCSATPTTPTRPARSGCCATTGTRG